MVCAPACVTTQMLAEESSGQVGCPPEEIVISDKKDGAFNLVWKAQCRGQTYFCTFGDPTACKLAAGTETPAPAAAETPAAVAPAAGGCQYDTQCKGERICEAGRCVEPTQRAAEPPPVAEPPPAATTPPATAPIGPARPPK